MLVVFRTDASSQLGLGHLRRCISLALALREIGARIRFVLKASDVDCLALLAEQGLRGELVDQALDVESDAEAFVHHCLGEQPTWALVDQYELDARWHRIVRRELGCRIAAIDDLADRPMSVEILIDHNYVAPPGHKRKYVGAMQEPSPRWLCGPRFALLGPAYAALRDFKVAPQVRSIGIFLGGTDPAKLTLPALEACRRIAAFQGPLEIVSTRSNPHLADIEQAVKADGKAVLSIDLPDLAGFYARHDLHIGAGGGSSWERCAVGTPTLVLCGAANQLAVIPALLALGALSGSADNTPEAIGQALKVLIDSAQARLRLSRNSRSLVDGQGASRVAMALGAETMQLRPAAMTDAETIWQWRNHSATRAASRDPAEIPFHSHRTWLEKRLDAEDMLLLIGHVGTRDVGVIRFDRLAESYGYEVSLYLDPALHGLGLGSILLRKGEFALVARGGVSTIHAEVLPGNAASRQLFEAAGYCADSANTYFKHQIPAGAAADSAPNLHSTQQTASS